MMKCFVCNGNGKISEHQWLSFYDPVDKLYECLTCKGTGEVEDTLVNVCHSLSGYTKALFDPAEKPVWHPRDEHPEFLEEGYNFLYVKIDGDSEYLDGHCLYSYPSYKTIMQINEGYDCYEEDDNVLSIIGVGLTDESWDEVVEWAYISPSHFEELKEIIKQLYASN